MRPLTILSRLGENSGYGNDEIVFFDRYDEKAVKNIRHFLLINEGFKLMYEPWGWKNEWYVDLVKINWHNENTVEFIDQYIDIIIEGNGPTYRIIDFEDYANAIINKKITVDEIKHQFIQIQNFLDGYLHRGKIFPPKIICELMNTEKIQL